MGNSLITISRVPQRSVFKTLGRGTCSVRLEDFPFCFLFVDHSPRCATRGLETSTPECDRQIARRDAIYSMTPHCAFSSFLSPSPFFFFFPSYSHPPPPFITPYIATPFTVSCRVWMGTFSVPTLLRMTTPRPPLMLLPRLFLFYIKGLTPYPPPFLD